MDTSYNLSKINKKTFFFKHDKINENQKLINRSSALFLVKHSIKRKVFTDLHLLNYWSIKGKIKKVKAKITLRRLNGKKLKSKAIYIDQINAYCLELKKFFAELKIDEFIGVVEIEIFSKKNLFFPYPAIYVRYHGVNWHTGTHSTTRYFSRTSGDDPELIKRHQAVNESNITLFSEKDLKCYVVLHNGLIKSTNTEISLIATNIHGKTIKKKINPLIMKIGETLIICVDDYLNYKNFLKNKRGMLSVNYENTGVFPRLLYFHENSDGQITLEHSNFGNSKQASKDSFKPKKSTRNLLYSIPILSKNYKTEIDFFPTYPIQKSPYSIICKKNTIDGKNLTNKKIKISKKSPFCQLTEKGLKKTTFLDIDIVNKAKLPNRFHVSQYYSRKNSLPGIILDGPVPINTKAPRTRWLPFFNEGRNLKSKIYICSRYYHPINLNKKIKLSLMLIGGLKNEKIKIEKEIKENENLELDISKILKGKKWKSNYGWMYITFNEPCHNTVFFSSEYKRSIIFNHAF
tara:strand:+ start:7599 stop:9149 length:1551 start_codon:yes stop_codon:yes gene_type:complete